MENKAEQNIVENNIKVTGDKVEVQYTSGGLGCMLTGAGIMTLASALILFVIVPDTSFIRAFTGVIIGSVGLLFFGPILFKILSVAFSGKSVFTVEGGFLKGRSKRVKINEIKDIKWAGGGIKYLLVRTKHNKTIKLSTYNLVPEDKVHQVIDTYVIPNGTPELKENWMKRYGNKGYSG
jgi:hypothetical protein